MTAWSAQGPRLADGVRDGLGRRRQPQPKRWGAYGCRSRPSSVCRSAVERFGNLGQLGRPKLARGEAVEVLEAHDQRSPRVGVDAVRLGQNVLIGVDANDG